ncbi:inositol monophosphatase family protein [Spongisporangium articulatum]|uniref:Inositol-1-monophosphatase n=1 Tax=Spongisporangium articulatum TaxID=3362603 RepID=A0ABW8AS70_9ACTN
MTVPPELVAQLRGFAEEIAVEAGTLSLTGPRAVTDTKSSPTDVVTATDRAVEDLLRARIAAARPDDAVLGEEGGFDGGGGRVGEGLTWVLDPIDGTVNFLYGQPQYAVSVAVVTGDPRVPGAWQPVAACVHQPVGGLSWTAGRGQGATLDGEPLAVRAPVDLAQALVATGFGYRADRRAGQARVLTGVVPAVRDIRRAGSAALDLCWVATGRLDAYYERGVNVWDIAAAALVLTEAGGVVTGLRGAPAGPEMTVAGPGPVAAALAGLLAELDADTDPQR